MSRLSHQDIWAGGSASILIFPTFARRISIIPGSSGAVVWNWPGTESLSVARKLLPMYCPVISRSLIFTPVTFLGDLGSWSMRMKSEYLILSTFRVFAMFVKAVRKMIKRRMYRATVFIFGGCSFMCNPEKFIPGKGGLVFHSTRPNEGIQIGGNRVRNSSKRIVCAWRATTLSDPLPGRSSAPTGRAGDVRTSFPPSMKERNRGGDRRPANQACPPSR